MIHDCCAKFRTNHIVKYADDTTVVGLIQGGDKKNYREEVKLFTDWCRVNNLTLNVEKNQGAGDRLQEESAHVRTNLQQKHCSGEGSAHSISERSCD